MNDKLCNTSHAEKVIDALLTLPGEVPSCDCDTAAQTLFETEVRSSDVPDFNASRFSWRMHKFVLTNFYKYITLVTGSAVHTVVGATKDFFVALHGVLFRAQYRPKPTVHHPMKELNRGV